MENRLETEGYIRHISVNMQGAHIDLPVFLLPVSGADLIIGTNWLSTVDPHIHDYKDLNIQFHYKGQKVTLQGDKYHKYTLKLLNTTISEGSLALMPLTSVMPFGLQQ